jgi:hypothetical protein
LPTCILAESRRILNAIRQSRQKILSNGDRKFFADQSQFFSLEKSIEEFSISHTSKHWNLNEN